MDRARDRLPREARQRGCQGRGGASGPLRGLRAGAGVALRGVAAHLASVPPLRQQDLRSAIPRHGMVPGVLADRLAGQGIGKEPRSPP